MVSLFYSDPLSCYKICGRVGKKPEKQSWSLRLMEQRDRKVLEYADKTLHCIANLEVALSPCLSLQCKAFLFVQASWVKIFWGVAKTIVVHYSEYCGVSPRSSVGMKDLHLPVPGSVPLAEKEPLCPRSCPSPSDCIQWLTAEGSRPLPGPSLHRVGWCLHWDWGEPSFFPCLLLLSPLLPKVWTLS